MKKLSLLAVASLPLILPIVGCSSGDTSPAKPPPSVPSTSTGNEVQRDREGKILVPRGKPAPTSSGVQTDRMGNPTGR